MQHFTRYISEWKVPLFIAFLFNFFLFFILPLLLQGDFKGKIDDDGLDYIKFYTIKLDKPLVKKHVTFKKKKKILKKTNIYKMPVKDLKIPYELDPRLAKGPPLARLPQILKNRPDFDFSGEFESGDIDNMLRPLSKVPPPYPFRARRMGIEGWVRIRFLINKKGNVEIVNVIEAAPKNVFEDSVRQSVLRWRFTPGMIEGEPVKTWVATTVKFNLD